MFGLTQIKLWEAQWTRAFELGPWHGPFCTLSYMVLKYILGFFPPGHKCRLSVWSCSVHCRVFSSVSSFSSLEANSFPSLRCDSQNVSSYTWPGLLWEAKLPRWKTIVPWDVSFTQKKRNLLDCDPQLYAGQFRRLLDLVIYWGLYVLICFGKSCFVPVVPPELFIVLPFTSKCIQIWMTNFIDTIGLSKIFKSSQLEKD